MMVFVIIGFVMGDFLLELVDSLVVKIGFGEILGKEFVVGGSYAIVGLLLILFKIGE